MPAVLRQLMRHSGIETTMAYYVDLDADAVADELWAGHESKRDAEGTILGTIAQNQAQEREKGSGA
jgi:hypothetical protein